MPTGAHDALTDVPGLRVGHADADGGLSGTTVVLAPPDGAVAGVDVRGAAPGTRETDLLHPGATVQRVHAVVLSGGSAYGLATAHGVMAWLEERGTGFAVPGGVVPIVPAAVVFDLGRGGSFTARPDAATGRAAAEAASDGPVAEGVVGAGRGATAGGLKGGTGTASTVLAGGAVVAALAVVNAAGSPVDAETGLLLGARALHDRDAPPTVTPAGRGALAALPAVVPALGTATTLAVVATDLALDKAGCARLATMGHDGLARALSPVHTVLDGDVVFGLSTAARPAPDLPGLLALHAAAADVVTRAVARGVLAAATTTTPAGTWPGYRDLAGR